MEAAQELNFLKENSSPGNHFTEQGFLFQPLAFSSLETQKGLNGDAIMGGSPWHCCVPAVTLSCLCCVLMAINNVHYCTKQMI